MKINLSILTALVIAGTLVGSLYSTGNLVNAQEFNITTANSTANSSQSSSTAAANSTVAPASSQTGLRPQIVLNSSQVTQGSSVQISGSNFNPNANVNLYLLSSASAQFQGGNLTLLQQAQAPPASAQPASSSTSTNGNIFSFALSKLEDMFHFGSSSTGTTAASQSSTGSGRVLVIIDSQFQNGTITLNCDSKDIGSASFSSNSGRATVWLSPPSGSYIVCSVDIKSNGETATASLRPLSITSSSAGATNTEFSDKDRIASVAADSQGSFSVQATIASDIKQGNYAVTAIQNNLAGFEQVSVTALPKSTTTTTTSNQTSTTTSSSSTNVSTASVQNSSNSNSNSGPSPSLISGSSSNVSSVLNSSSLAQILRNNSQTTGTNTTAGQTSNATVQLNNSTASPGTQITVSGHGFKPASQVQIFINNVQITNVITNIEGSFNSVIVVPASISAGSAQVQVRSGQTNITQNVTVVSQTNQNTGPATVSFESVSAADSSSLTGAPVTVFDTSTGQVVGSGKTPLKLDLSGGTYSVFYSNFNNYQFASASPGQWTKVNDGGAGILTVQAGQTLTVTATYNQASPPSPPPVSPSNSMVLNSIDTSGNQIQGMFVTVYDSSGKKIDQGFTPLTVQGLAAGTYPIFFANFANLVFQTAVPGTWVQTPYGGSGLVSIVNAGQSQNVAVTAVYARTSAQPQAFNLNAPLDIKGYIYTVTSNQTTPQGPFVISGLFTLKVDSAGTPGSASFSAHLVSARDDANMNVRLDSQASRDEHTLQITNFKTKLAQPIGPQEFVVYGTADLLRDGNLYSGSEDIMILISGGTNQSPTNVQAQFLGKQANSAADWLGDLFGVVTDGFH
jgi:hypothetical protein